MIASLYNVCRHQTMTAPVIRIDLDSPVPAYRQIASAMRALLVAGTFPVGHTLPTVRQLAVDLGVHHNTVAEAYRLLADEGWLALRRRHGAIVLDRSRPEAPPEARSSLLRQLRELTAQAHAQGLTATAIADTMRAVAAQLAAGKLTRT
jgi:DNA-binding transcriptional regulator YhcF (GntR family)